MATTYHNISTAVDIVLFSFELLVMLVMIGLGSWKGGISIGLFGCLGVAIYGFGFQMAPGSIAFDVIQLIMAAVCCIAAVQVAGGLDYVVHLVNKALRKFPKMITILAPLLTFGMTVLCGTGHTAYSALPVIIEVSKDFGIRPSRPLAAAVISGQMAICASPISAAVVYLTKLLEGKVDGFEGVNGPSYIRVLSVTIPANLIGCMLTSIVCLFLGKDLYKDPEFLRRVADGRCKLRLPLPPEVEAKVQIIREGLRRSEEHPHGTTPIAEEGKNLIWEPSFAHSERGYHDVEKPTNATAYEPEPKKFGWRAKTSVILLVIGMLIVMVYALLISENLHIFTPKVQRDAAITSVLLTIAAIIVVVCGVDAKAVTNSSIFIAGMVGSVCVLGVAWMARTFLSWWMPQITEILSETLQKQPWTLAILLFAAGAIMYSQAATAQALMPLAIHTHVDFRGIVAAFPAVSSVFVLPTYPTMIAACLMDDTGSTKSGNWVFDHSLFIPGLIAIILTVGAGFGLAYAYLGTYEY